MDSPRIELTPRRPAVCTDATVTLDLLVKIVPPPVDRSRSRPPLNLGLVIDRSGSMAGTRKIDYARQAASFAVEQLLPEDRVSLTIFDNEVKTIVPNAPGGEKAELLRAIAGIQPRGATDLHGGWAEGIAQVESHPVKGGLNRVLLLSDGEANQGLTDPNAIAIEVKTAAQRGVGTTTLGLGDHYNEDLLEAMARNGDGNYYYVESPVQLTDLFQTELQGLMATLGRDVRLSIEPAEGVILGDVLNDLQRHSGGALVLPNLIVGMPILVFLRFTVPARSETGPLCALSLSWDSPEGGPRREQSASFVAPEVMPLEWWAAMPEDPSVVEQEALLMSARAQKEAAEATRRGQYSESMSLLNQSEAYLDYAPSSIVIDEERDSLGLTRSALDSGDYLRMMKRAKQQSYRRSQSKPNIPEPPNPPEPPES